ncbi:hypothetical protein J6590_010791 [Homalodisca vitripennis]|nr:hypothetical protein J6590_010791 [Homalodisca vitripennis]
MCAAISLNLEIAQRSSQDKSHLSTGDVIANGDRRVTDSPSFDGNSCDFILLWIWEAKDLRREVIDLQRSRKAPATIFSPVARPSRC